MLIVTTVCFILLRNVYFRLVAPLAWKFTDHGSTESLKPQNERTTHEFVARKVLKYSYHFLWFSVMCPWCLTICRRADWFDITYSSRMGSGLIDHLYGLTRDKAGEMIAIDLNEPWLQEMHVFMLIQFAWYAHNFIEDTLWDRNRSDYSMMVCHHLIAMILIGLQFQADAHRYALYTMLPMDIMDYILFGAKILQVYGSTTDGVPRGRGWKMAINCAMVFVFMSWIITRWYMYGRILWVSGTLLYFEDGILDPDGRYKEGLPAHINILFGLGVCLMVLQLIWGGIICKIVVKLLRKGYVKDDTMNTFKKKEA